MVYTDRLVPLWVKIVKISSSHYAVLGLCLICLGNPKSVYAQGFGEMAGINAGVVGMGAGLAAIDKGRMLKQGTAYVQQSMASQTKAINDCMQLDNQYEMKKDWENAEKCLTIALQYIAKRDGPGSAKSVPVLSRLVKVEEEQNKLDEAIGYQKTVLVFNKAGKVVKPDVTHESLVLSSLYVKNSDFTHAEPVLRESIALEKPKPVKSAEYKKTLKVFGSVLRKNQKPDEAAVVESELIAIESAPITDAADTNAQSSLVPQATAPADVVAAPTTSPPSAPISSPVSIPTSIPASVPTTSPAAVAPASAADSGAASALGLPDGVPIQPATTPEYTPLPPAIQTKPQATETTISPPASANTSPTASPTTSPTEQDKSQTSGDTAPQP